MLLKAIAPYTRVKLPYLASELNGIPLEDVEDLLVSLILDGKVDGKIDQVKTRGGLGVDRTFGPDFRGAAVNTLTYMEAVVMGSLEVAGHFFFGSAYERCIF